jgi:hypothetical protein
VVDAEYFFYEPTDNTYQRGREDNGLLTGRPYPLLSNFQPGPLVGGYIEELASGLPKKTAFLLGKRVTNFGDVFWIDEKHQFMLRQVGADAGRTRFLVEVTKVDYNPRLNPSVFDFTPPAGATAKAIPTPGTLAIPPPGPNATRTAGLDFWDPSYVPPSYRDSGSSSVIGSNLSYSEVRYRHVSGTGEFTIRQEQRSGSATRTPAEATAVAIAGRIVTPSPGGNERVVTFTLRDRVITVSSATLPLEELQRVAESIP